VALIASTRERPYGSDELFAFGVDRDGRLRAVDAVFARLSGFGPGDAVDAMRHPEISLAALRAPFGPEVGTAHLRLVASDGAWFRAVIVAAPVDDGWVAVGFEPSSPGLSLEVPAAFVAEVDARRPVATGEAAELLVALSRRLAGYGGLSDALRRRSGFVEELAESIRLFSLNAILAAHRLRDSAAIGAVAGLMKTRSDAAGPDILALGGDIEAAFGVLEAARFRVAVGRVQAEALPAAPWVGEALAASLDAVIELVPALDAALDQLARRSAAVEEHLKTLRFLELQGRIEAARSEDTQHVRMLFEEIGQQVRAAGGELKAFVAQRDRDVAELVREARRQAAALRS
jgi:hypothetical protein